MASLVNAAVCAIVAGTFWTFLGYAIAHHILPRALAIGTAPILGWAAASAVTLPIFFLVPFSPLTISITVMVAAAAALAVFLAGPAKSETNAPTIPVYAIAAAALLAIVPALAVAPKVSAESVQLAAPVFDHSKIAVIDAIARLGLPAVNPFYGAGGEPGRLAYYYLYYFSAAEVVQVLRITGWEADIGLTWFAAFASLALSMGIAVHFSERASSAIWVPILASATSLRELLAKVFGAARIDALLAPASGFGGWLFEAAWVPQHLASAACTVAAILIMSHYAWRRSIAALLTLAVLVVAGFESSTYVGGVTFAVAAVLAVPLLLLKLEPDLRLRFLGGIIIAALLAFCVALPFILDQIAIIGRRETGPPILIHPYEVLSDKVLASMRRLLDLPAYWLIFLTVELPAAFLAGVIAFAALLRSQLRQQERLLAVALAALAATGLCVSWLLLSSLGGNNDLGWRAALPGTMILVAIASAVIGRAPRNIAVLAIALGGLALSLPETVGMIRYNATGEPTPEAKIFAQTPEMWAAVRRHTPPGRRVGNNPLFLKDMTPWPVNISWALLSDRSSCYATLHLAIAYVPVPAERREAIDAQFIRVFEGKGSAEDVAALARQHGCDVILLTPYDKAWDSDPFATSPDYELAESDPRWRIYKRKPNAAATGTR
jgi:hypothetical protein